MRGANNCKWIFVLFFILFLPSITYALSLPTEIGPYTIGQGQSKSYTILIENERNYTVWVIIDKSNLGNISSWFAFFENNISISPYTSKYFDFVLLIPESIEDGNYTGTLTFKEYNGSDLIGTYQRTITISVTKYTHEIFDDNLYLGHTLKFGDYEVTTTDVATNGLVCMFNITKNGELLHYNLIVGSQWQEVDNHFKMSVISGYSSQNYQLCRIVILADDDYSTSIISNSNQQSSSSQQSSVTESSINLYGNPLPSSNILIEVVGATENGTLIIQSPSGEATTPTEIDNGIWSYSIPSNAVGTYAVFYRESGQTLARAFFTIITGQNGTEFKTQNQTIGTNPLGSGYLSISSRNSFLPTEDIEVTVEDRDYFQPIAGAGVKLRSQTCNVDLTAYTTEWGKAIFTAPASGWCESNDYSITVAKPGYTSASKSITVQKQRYESELRFKLGNMTLSEDDYIYTGITYTVELYDAETGDIINYNGDGTLTLNGNSTKIKFDNGVARFIVNSNGTLRVSVSGDDLDKLSYYGCSSDKMEVIQYTPAPQPGPGWITVPIIVIIIGLVIVIVLAKKHKSKGSMKVPTLKPVKEQPKLPPAVETFTEE